MTGDTDTTHTQNHFRDEPSADAHPTATPDNALPFPPFAEAEATLRGLVQTYPLLTLAGAVLGGYAVARLLRRIR